MREWGNAFLVALQFLTRVPVPRQRNFSQEALAKSSVFFPVVGALIGFGGVILHRLLVPHVDGPVFVVLVLIYLVLLTGGLHEDAMADAADGFGGGWNKEQILEIMRDSRIGSFGAVAITLSLLARYAFLTSLSPAGFDGVFVAGQVFSRWTCLPLAYWLRSAREGTGQGILIAGKITTASLVVGTLLATAMVVALVGMVAIWMLLAAAAIAALCGVYFRSRIGGITGDCLGATVQITEAGIYLLGVLLQ